MTATATRNGRPKPERSIEALPHVVHQVRVWFLTMKSIGAQVDRLYALGDDGQGDAITRLEAIAARLNELNHEVGNRLTEWVLIVDEQRRQEVARRG